MDAGTGASLMGLTELPPASVRAGDKMPRLFDGTCGGNCNGYLLGEHDRVFAFQKYSTASGLHPQEGSCTSPTADSRNYPVSAAVMQATGTVPNLGCYDADTPPERMYDGEACKVCRLKPMSTNADGSLIVPETPRFLGCLSHAECANNAPFTHCILPG